MPAYLVRLYAILETCGLKIDGERVTTGTRKAGFRSLAIGVGAHPALLADCRRILIASELTFDNCSRLTHVDNADHADYGKVFLEVSSFWWSEEQ